jgi:quercetin dioxygenase-like cupin family protein
MTSSRVALPAMALLAFSFAFAVRAADMPSPLQAAEMKWGPAPPVLPTGAQMVVLAGDPGSNGLITLRLKLPPNYVIPPHWHPTDEHVTVISGSLALGMGDKLDRRSSKLLKAGGYGVAPANMHHFAWTKAGAIVQVNLIGPFALTYVNAADDPSHRK